MNVIEAAEKAGWSELGADLWGATFDGAMTKDALERFAQVIRNQALEEAAKACEEQVGGLSMFATSRECIANNGAARACASAIRAMKKEQPNG